jgi:hypothetical protein
MDPVISDHARERAAQMGISTKVAKRIVRNPTMVLPDFQGREDRRFMFSRDEPEYAVVVEESDAPRPTVVTILYYMPESRFERPT